MKSNIPLSSATLLRFYKAWMANHPEMDRTTNGLCNCLEAYVGVTVLQLKDGVPTC